MQFLVIKGCRTLKTRDHFGMMCLLYGLMICFMHLTQCHEHVTEGGKHGGQKNEI